MVNQKDPTPVRAKRFSIKKQGGRKQGGNPAISANSRMKINDKSYILHTT